MTKSIKDHKNCLGKIIEKEEIKVILFCDTCDWYSVITAEKDIKEAIVDKRR